MAVARADTTAARRESGNRLFFVVLTALAVTHSIGVGAHLSTLVPLLGSYICVGWLVFVWSRSKMNFSTFAVIREIETPTHAAAPQTLGIGAAFGTDSNCFPCVAIRLCSRR